MVAVILGILFKGQNVAFMVGLAFAVAASGNFPALLLSIVWARFNTAGAVWSIVTGALAGGHPDRAEPDDLGRSAASQRSDVPVAQPGDRVDAGRVSGRASSRRCWCASRRPRRSSTTRSCARIWASGLNKSKMRIADC